MSYVPLQGPSASPVLFICTLSLSWFLWYCLRQLLWKRAQNLGSPTEAFHPILCFAASSTVFHPWQFKHCSGLSCPNTYISRWSSFVTLYYRKYSPVWKLPFRSCGRTPGRSRFLNCFGIICGRFEVINLLARQKDFLLARQKRPTTMFLVRQTETSDGTLSC